MLTFDILLYCANTPNKRWEEYEKVMEGLQDNSVDIYSDQYLSTFMMSPPNKVKDMKVYFMIAVKKGDLIELDYALAYVSDRCDTVLNILNMNTTDRVHYFKMYDNIAKSVSPKVYEHFLEYIELSLERFKHAKPPANVRTTSSVHRLTTYTCAKTNLRLCDNAVCRKRMECPFVCARCKTAKYCDKVCQTAAWKAGHKTECKTADAK